MSKRKQIDTLHEKEMILMIILQMIHHILNNVVKEEKPLTLQQRKDRIISLTNIKGYNILILLILKMVDQKKQL